LEEQKLYRRSAPSAKVKLPKKYQPTKRGRPPIVDAEKLKVLHSKGYSDCKIAELMGVKVKTIEKARKKLNLSANKPSKNKKIDYNVLRFFLWQGKSDGEIALEIGVSKSAVTKARQRLKLEANFRVGQRAAADTGNAGCSDPDVAWMIEQQKIHAVEMSKSITVSNGDLLKWAGSGYAFEAESGTYYYHFRNKEEKPADIPKKIPAKNPYASEGQTCKKGKAGGRISLSCTVSATSLTRA